MTVLVEKTTVNMEEGINNLIDGMITDYNKWTDNERMQAEFANGFDVRKGQKYIKVINRNGVTSFIVNTTEDKIFEYGDILKPAGWNAPARNAPRGNVLEGNYQIQWTGPLYLS